ncbi:MAG: hypothetical protein JW937_05380 [Candidatus Omnitrophica bacterium]|nr:hypothetical protein [Candidatus Omnitrophota bacterium]
MNKLIGGSLIALLASLTIAAAPAAASVQNVKISGDIDAKAIYQTNYDLKRNDQTIGTANALTRYADTEGYFLSTVRVRVDADLTDNVSTTVRLLNQRRWGADGASTGDIDLNLANLTLNEVMYSPLSLIIGRQDLNYGRGFIIGAGILADPNAVFTQATVTGLPAATQDSGATYTVLNGREYSAYNSFDAIRAVLDLDPVTIDGFIAQVVESGQARNDNMIWGVEGSYRLEDNMDTSVDLYYFGKNDEAFAATDALRFGVNGAGSYGLNNNNNTGVISVYEANQVHTIGGLVQSEVVEGMMLTGELAYQFGELQDGTINGTQTALAADRDRSAWAFNLEGAMNFNELMNEDVSWNPTGGMGFLYLSGEEAGNSGDYGAWDNMYRGHFFSGIRDFLAGTQGDGLYSTGDPYDSAGNTNTMALYFDAGAELMDDLHLSGRYLHFWFDEKPLAGRDDGAGDEIDLKLVYDYTEDVQFGLSALWFIPGNYYEGENDNTPINAGNATGNGVGNKSEDVAFGLTGSVTVNF